MGTTKCPECGCEVNDCVTECPHCGCPIVKVKNNDYEFERSTQLSSLESQERPKSKLWLWIVLAVIVCAIGSVAYWYASKDNASDTEQTENVTEGTRDASLFTSPDLTFNQLKGEVSKVEWLSTEDVQNPIAFTYDDEGNMYPVQSNYRPSNSYYRNDKGEITQESAPDNEYTYMYEWSDGRVALKYDDFNADDPDRARYSTYYHYDSNGILQKTTRDYFGGEGGEMKDLQTVYTDYKFDDFGNWISRNFTTSYDFRDWGDEGDENAWRKEKSTGKEYRVIKYRNRDSGAVKSIKDVQREWKTEQGIE